jgi:hypothetical protein
MGNKDRTSSAEIVIPASEIHGNPRPKALGQWVPHEERHWWTEDALAAKRGLSPDLTTGAFIETTAEGWRFKVFTDTERTNLFRARSSATG